MKKVEALTDGLVLGALVQYYENGWRHGYLESIKGQTAKVRPIAMYNSNPNRLTVHLTNIKPEDNVS